MVQDDPEVPEPFLAAARELLEAHPPSAGESYRLPLTSLTLGAEEIAAAFEALVRGPLTQGPRVRALEREFAADHGVPVALFCNSGSSANLLAISCLAGGGGEGPADEPLLQPGGEVIVPALTWSTTLWPVVQVGAIPVLADVSPETLNVTVESVERALSPRTRAVFVAHTLGNPAPVDDLARLCAAKRITLVEDACESLDACIDGRRVGTFGRLATFSFYFSHHITTIEGGMVLASDAGDEARLRMLRAHGWSRDLPEERRRALEAENPDLDPRFLFVSTGYNLRGTEVQAAIGRVQMRRRAAFLAHRRRVAASWTAALQRHPEIFAPVRFAPGASPFALPLVLRAGSGATRRRLTRFLEDSGIETRPLVAGNLARQPAMRRVAHRLAGPLDGADALHERAIYIGIHPTLSDGQIGYFSETLDRFAAEVTP